jgi:hypothetical protein
MKVGSAWQEITSISGLTISEPQSAAFLVYPGSASMVGWSATPVDSRAPRRYRIQISTNANGTTKTMTYGVTCVHLL